MNSLLDKIQDFRNICCIVDDESTAATPFEQKPVRPQVNSNMTKSKHRLTQEETTEFQELTDSTTVTTRVSERLAPIVISE